MCRVLALSPGRYYAWRHREPSARAVADVDLQVLIAASHVVTRHPSARTDAGVASGRVKVTTHTDFLDYASLRPVLADVDAVSWALGTSGANVTRDEYTAIHVEFPVAFVREWLAVRGRDAGRSFHLVSGMGASSNASSHWAREKARVGALVPATSESGTDAPSPPGPACRPPVPV